MQYSHDTTAPATFAGHSALHIITITSQIHAILHRLPDSWYSIVDAQLQLALLILLSPLSFHVLHVSPAWLPFPFHPTFILPHPAVCTGGNSISPLVHNASLLATRSLPPRVPKVYSKLVPAGYLRFCGQRN